MSTITLQEAQASLTDLIHRMPPGGEVLITENDLTVAKLVAPPPLPTRKPPQLGLGKGTVLYMAPDFDAPLEDFAEYM
jgi:antitoxin (DNA-binding transcriptional repressor) of toxin-antitoxin stability system